MSAETDHGQGEAITVKGIVRRVAPEAEPRVVESLNYTEATLTTEQVSRRQKTVTRRLGWKTAKPGDVVQPVVKGQGLKKGEKVECIGGPIRFTSVSRVRLGDISPQDVYREGFPTMTPREFVVMFKKHNGGLKDQIVTRIQFEYL